MEAASERRDPHQARVPLDDVLVELRHEDYEDAFEADGVNVGVGGLSMRGAILPDVGSRLRCSFTSPLDGCLVDADAEVVWAQDRGAHVGEFGLRFTELQGRDQNAILALVGAWSAALAEPESLAGNDDEIEAPKPTLTIRLDGVQQPIEAEVAHRSEDALVLEQPLPFLRIGTTVREDEQGRRGELQAVDLRLAGETPRLVLTVWYDESIPGAALDEDASLDGPEGSSLGADSTLVDGESSDPPLADRTSLADREKRGAQVRHERTSQEPGRDDDEEPAIHASACPPERQDAAKVVRLPDANAEDRDSQDAEALAQMRPDARARLAALGASLTPLWTRTRALAAVAAAKAGPWAHALGRLSKKAAAGLRNRIGPRMRAMSRAVARRLGRTRRTSGPPPRRQTRATKRRGAASAQKAQKKAPGRKGRGRRVVGLGVLGLLALGAAQLGGGQGPLGKRAERAVATPAPALAATTAIATDTSSEDVQPAMPRAMPEPERRAGPMPEPAFPSLDEARRPAAPGTVPSDSPYAEVQPEATPPSAYGAEAVPGGQEFTLRLSQTPANLHGRATDAGFEVRVVGARPLDPARPISQQMTSVVSSSIVRDGNDSVLRIRFVGRPTPHRVEVRGTRLVVTLS